MLLPHAVHLCLFSPSTMFPLQMIRSVRDYNKKTIFGKDSFADLSKQVHASKQATAVFVGVNMLTSVQLGTLQKWWKLPVYDRYYNIIIILQYFIPSERPP